MSETVVLDFELNSPIERVWHALTDSATLSKWMLFEENNFKPVVGYTFQFRKSPGWDGVVECEVIEVEQPHRLVYTWVSGMTIESRISTLITWTLSEAAAGVTRVHLEQSGFEPGAKQEIGGAKHGWSRMHDQLKHVLEQASLIHPPANG